MPSSFFLVFQTTDASQPHLVRNKLQISVHWLWESQNPVGCSWMLDTWWRSINLPPFPSLVWSQAIDTSAVSLGVNSKLVKLSIKLWDIVWGKWPMLGNQPVKVRAFHVCVCMCVWTSMHYLSPTASLELHDVIVEFRIWIRQGKAWFGVATHGSLRAIPQVELSFSECKISVW